MINEIKKSTLIMQHQIENINKEIRIIKKEPNSNYTVEKSQEMKIKIHQRG